MPPRVSMSRSRKRFEVRWLRYVRITTSVGSSTARAAIRSICWTRSNRSLALDVTRPPGRSAWDATFSPPMICSPMRSYCSSAASMTGSPSLSAAAVSMSETTAALGECRPTKLREDIPPLLRIKPGGARLLVRGRGGGASGQLRARCLFSIAAQHRAGSGVRLSGQTELWRGKCSAAGRAERLDPPQAVIYVRDPADPNSPRYIRMYFSMRRFNFHLSQDYRDHMLGKRSLGVKDAAIMQSWKLSQSRRPGLRQRKRNGWPCSGRIDDQCSSRTIILEMRGGRRAIQGDYVPDGFEKYLRVTYQPPSTCRKTHFGKIHFAALTIEGPLSQCHQTDEVAFVVGRARG